MKTYRSRLSALLTFLTVSALAGGCTTDSGGSDFTLPGFTILDGSVMENGDGSISVPVDGGATLLLDDVIADSSARMTITGRYDGTHLTFKLFGGDLLDKGFELFILRTDQDQLFMNILHPSQGGLSNISLPGPYSIGDTFTIRCEVVNRVGMVRVRVWTPGDGFSDSPALDTDDLTPITPWGIATGMRAGLGIIGATIRAIEVTPLP